MSCIGMPSEAGGDAAGTPSGGVGGPSVNIVPDFTRCPQEGQNEPPVVGSMGRLQLGQVGLSPKAVPPLAVSAAAASNSLCL